MKGISKSIITKPDCLNNNFLEVKTFDDQKTAQNSRDGTPTTAGEHITKFLNPALIDQKIVNRDLINLQIRRSNSATKT